MLLLLTMIDSPVQRTIVQTLYEEYANMLYCVAYNTIGDETLAEDAVSDAFLKLVQRYDEIIARLYGKENINVSNKFHDLCPKLVPYVVIMVRNASKDIIKRRNRAESYPGDEEVLNLFHTGSDEYTADDYVFEQHSVQKIKEAIDKLSDTLRDTMYRHYILELDIAEIAKDDEVSYNTVRKRIQRGRTALAELLEGEL